MSAKISKRILKAFWWFWNKLYGIDKKWIHQKYEKSNFCTEENESTKYLKFIYNFVLDVNLTFVIFNYFLTEPFFGKTGYYIHTP